MKATFDILLEPWIPVVEEDGTTRELGLLEVLERAHQLRAVQDPSPLVEYSVYRFLIVFLMDMLRPEDTEALEELLEEGQFDPDEIRDYVAMCQAEGVSFDLLDEERPFLQTAYRVEWDQKPKPVSILDYTVPNGNNHIHFDHRQEQMAYTPGKALRMMLAAQIFCTAGVQGYPSNVNGAPPWFALIRGESLFQTLILGMLDLDHIGIPFDQPPVLWRNTEEVEAKKQVAQTSWLFGMLFPARRIHLIPDEDGNAVSHVYFSQGMNYQVTNAWTDPHVAYRLSDKGRFNWKPSEDESIWRNLTCLIDLKQAPQIVSQYMDLDQPDGELLLTLYGVQTNQASYLRSQRYDLSLPVKLLGNEYALHYVADYIDRAERLGRALYKSLQQKEIPDESRVQAKQHFYAECEQLLWKELDALTKPNVDYIARAEQIREAQIRVALSCADWVLGQLNLRGRAMVQVMGSQEKILQKEIAAIRKRGDKS